jgi:hypothetical protein
MSESKPPRASAADREHFARVARQMRELDDEIAPTSLEEALRRMDLILVRLGRWARPGVSGDTDGDLYSHLAMLREPRRKPSDVS